MHPFNSRFAFSALLVTLRPTVICDIGSCDGEESLRFRLLRRHARIVAFEANPDNVKRIREDPKIQQAGIEVVPKAVTASSGPVTFYVLEQTDDAAWAKAASSLKQRSEQANPGLVETPTTVDGVRIDEFLRDAPGPIALWIDVEGAAADVVEGIRDIADKVVAVHVEVETDEMWVGQNTREAVITQFAAMGLRVLGHTPQTRGKQDNLLLVRARLTVAQRAAVAAALVVARAYPMARRLTRFGARRRA